MFTRTGLNDQVRRCWRAAGAPAFEARDVAPSTLADTLASWGASRRLFVWSGGTVSAIYRDPRVNYMFRAWHDLTHCRVGFSFEVAGEVIGARVQAAFAARVVGDVFADVVWLEIAGQALALADTGAFLADQYAWTAAQLRGGRYRPPRHAGDPRMRGIL